MGIGPKRVDLKARPITSIDQLEQSASTVYDYLRKELRNNPPGSAGSLDVEYLNFLDDLALGLLQDLSIFFRITGGPHSVNQMGRISGLREMLEGLRAFIKRLTIGNVKNAPKKIYPPGVYGQTSPDGEIAGLGAIPDYGGIDGGIDGGMSLQGGFGFYGGRSGQATDAPAYSVPSSDGESDNQTGYSVQNLNPNESRPELPQDSDFVTTHWETECKTKEDGTVECTAPKPATETGSETDDDPPDEDGSETGYLPDDGGREPMTKKEWAQAMFGAWADERQAQMQAVKEEIGYDKAGLGAFIGSLGKPPPAPWEGSAEDDDPEKIKHYIQDEVQRLGLSPGAAGRLAQEEYMFESGIYDPVSRSGGSVQMVAVADGQVEPRKKFGDGEG